MRTRPFALAAETNSSQTLSVEQLWRWFEVKTCLVEPIIGLNGTVGRPGPTKCFSVYVP
jgi:hypothetical protein